MRGPTNGENPNDYLSITLLDEAPVIQAIQRLRTVYPKTMEINYRYQQEAINFSPDRRSDRPALSGLELFEAFAGWSTQKPLTEQQRTTIAGIMDEVVAAGGESR